MIMSAYTAEEKQTLLKIAYESIHEGLIKKQPVRIRLFDFSENLRQERASFVTLEKNGALRGCIGSLQADRPLVQDVASNAFSAAFRDPRFHALTIEECKEIGIHISVLSSPEAMQFDSEADLLRRIRPGIDGLILADGNHRGTFLPSVWEQLPTANLFFMHLKNKAGLPGNYWSNTLQVERYTTEVIK
jgi:uncharacterized protein